MTDGWTDGRTPHVDIGRVYASHRAAKINLGLIHVMFIRQAYIHVTNVHAQNQGQIKIKSNRRKKIENRSTYIAYTQKLNQQIRYAETACFAIRSVGVKM